MRKWRGEEESGGVREWRGERVAKLSEVGCGGVEG